MVSKDVQPQPDPWGALTGLGAGGGAQSVAPRIGSQGFKWSSLVWGVGIQTFWVQASVLALPAVRLWARLCLGVCDSPAR